MKHYASSLFIVLLLLASASVHAQKELEINFQDIDTAKLSKTFNYKEKARVKIKNINRFIYKLIEEMTAEDFNTTVPSILSSIKLPSFFTSQIPALGSASLDKAVAVGQYSPALQTDYKDKLKDLIMVWRVINEAIDKHNEIVHISKDCSKSFSTIETEVKTTFATFVGGTTMESVTALADKMQTLLAGKIELSNNIFNDMEELLTAWKTERLKDYRAGQVTDADILATMNSDLKVLQEKKPVVQTLVNAKEKEVRDQTRKIKEADENYATVVKDNEAILEKAKTLFG